MSVVKKISLSKKNIKTTTFFIQIPIPELIKAYNEKMGGVDLVDNMVACYRIPYRLKKWWYPMYGWSLSISAVNGWRLRMRVMIMFRYNQNNVSIICYTAY